MELFTSRRFQVQSPGICEAFKPVLDPGQNLVGVAGRVVDEGGPLVEDGLFLEGHGATVGRSIRDLLQILVDRLHIRFLRNHFVDSNGDRKIG